MSRYSSPSKGADVSALENDLISLSKKTPERLRPLRSEYMSGVIGNAKIFDKKAILVITYDDGDLEDYTVALPIHKQYGVPGVSYVNPRMTMFPQDRPSAWGSNVMTVDQLKQLESVEGWEIGHHTYSHQRCAADNLAEAITAGATTFKLTGISFQVKSYDPVRGGRNIEVVIEENGIAEEALIIAADKVDGQYIESYTVSAPLLNSFTTAAKVRLTDAELTREIDQGRGILDSWGLEVVNLAFPWGSSTDHARRAVARNHATGRSTGGTHNGKRFVPNATYSMASPGLLDLTNSEVDTLLNECRDNKTLLISISHGKDLVVGATGQQRQDALHYLIQGAQSRGIEIMTLKDAMKYHSNLLSLGTHPSDNGVFMSDDGALTTKKTLVQARRAGSTMYTDANVWKKFVYDAPFAVNGDALGEYNATTGVFSPRLSGIYLVTAGLEWSNTTTNAKTRIGLYKNGVLEQYLDEKNGDSAQRTNNKGSAIIQLSEGDTVEIYVWTSVAQSTYSVGSDRGRLSITRLV